MNHFSIRFFSRSCGQSLPAPGRNSSTGLAALLSFLPARKLLCPQLLSKQEFGSTAIHRLPQASFQARGGPFLQAPCESPAGLCSREHTRDPAQLAQCLCSYALQVPLGQLEPASRQSPASLSSANAAQVQAGWRGAWQCLVAMGTVWLFK